MPQGDKSAYTDKQKRKAAAIEDSYEARGVSHNEAEARAWATVNKDDGGGKKSGSGRGKEDGKASASRSAAERSASAKKAAATRKRNAEHHAH
nr:plasmid stabilization protein [uncultured Devosia sp.]